MLVLVFVYHKGCSLTLWQFIDREAGVCGLVGTQVFPPSDPKVRAWMKEFEDMVYSKL
jgi:hypothetical protein